MKYMLRNDGTLFTVDEFPTKAVKSIGSEYKDLQLINGCAWLFLHSATDEVKSFCINLLAQWIDENLFSEPANRFSDCKEAAIKNEFPHTNDFMKFLNDSKFVLEDETFDEPYEEQIKKLENILNQAFIMFDLNVDGRAIFYAKSINFDWTYFIRCCCESMPIVKFTVTRGEKPCEWCDAKKYIAGTKSAIQDIADWDFFTKDAYQLNRIFAYENKKIEESTES